MLLCLAGDRLNSGCDVAPLCMPSDPLAWLQLGLRDTLVHHFLRGLEAPAWVPVPDATERDCRPLLELALCLTAHEVA